MLFRCAINKSFQVSVSPGKHQCMQSSCFLPPAVDGWASALNSLMWVMFNMWKLEPLRALSRCIFTRRASTFVPLFSVAKNSSTCHNSQSISTWIIIGSNIFIQKPHRSLLLLVSKAGNADRNHLDPSHPLQNVEGIVSGRIKMCLAAYFSVQMISGTRKPRG